MSLNYLFLIKLLINIQVTFLKFQGLNWDLGVIWIKSNIVFSVGNSYYIMYYIICNKNGFFYYCLVIFKFQFWGFFFFIIVFCLKFMFQYKLCRKRYGK